MEYVDTFAKNLHIQLEARNLTDIVDIIFVSDHGMTDTSHPDLVYLDEILGAEGYSYIEHEDGECTAFPSCFIVILKHFLPTMTVRSKLILALASSSFYLTGS